jgi:hypothetical protein
MNKIEILIEELTAQLAKPARAVVNSECAFVMDRLNTRGERDLAKEYWSWTCGSWEKDPRYGEQVQELQAALRAIDKSITMPEWGIRGT